MTPMTYFFAWCLLCGGVVLFVAGMVATIWGLDRCAPPGTPRPWPLVFVALVMMIVGFSSFFTIIEFWKQW